LQQLAEQRLCVFVIVRESSSDRRKVKSLTRVGRQLGRSREHWARGTSLRRIAASQMQVGLQHVRHHKRRRILQRGREVSLGTGTPTLERGKCMLECVQRYGCRAGDCARAEVEQAVT
jgi:hypothetical protein